MSISKHIFMVALMGAASFARAEVPARVVSVNVCTDQLAMMLAPPEQIVSVTFLARDPMTSPMAEVAKNYDINHAQIEEIVMLKPDLVLANSWTSPFLLSMLDEFEIAYLQVEMPETLDEVPAHVIALGKLLGREERAGELVHAFEERLGELDGRDEGEVRTIAPYGPRGWMGGTSGLGADILKRAGFANISEAAGYLPLEELVMAKPDVILTSSLYPAASQGEAILGHPALQSSFVHELERDSSWGCGTPAALDAYAELLDVKARLQ